MVLSALLVFCMGCSRQLTTDMPIDSAAPLAQGDSDKKLNSSQFGQTLTLTVLNFSLDDCRTDLYAVKRAMDELNAVTQRDHWESSKQRYEALKVTYRQLYQQWAQMQRDRGIEAETRISVQTKLDELAPMFQAADNRIEGCERDYLQARQEYEAKKKQFFMAFLGDLQAMDVAEGRIYTDTSVTLGLSAVDVLAQHVLVTVEAYAKAAITLSVDSEEKGPATPQGGLCSLRDLEKQIRLVDSQGRAFSPPVDMEYDRLCTVGGLILTLAYERRSDAGRIPDRLVIEASAFKNIAPISLAIPSNLHDSDVSNPLKTADLFAENPPHGPNQANQQTIVIRCKRAGMHLKVPVTVDIHGVEVKTDMILDTGASVTVLAKSLYSQGLSKPLDSLPHIRMKTANGMITCPVDTLKISTAAYANKIAVALTNDSTSLLGANFFAGRRITIDLENECISIHP